MAHRDRDDSTSWAFKSLGQIPRPPNLWGCASSGSPNLYAAIRQEQRDAAYLAAFVALAKETCFKTLVGIVPADEEVAAA